MRTIIVILFASLISISAFSQERVRSFFRKEKQEVFVPVNELKLNLGTTVFLLYPEISYERVFKEDLSFGFSAGINLNPNHYFMNSYLNFNLTPYFRWFFGGNRVATQKTGAGFFIEGSGSFFGANDYYNRYYYDCYESGFCGTYHNRSSTAGAGIGLGIGWKYISKNNWVGEFMLGAGRDLVNTSRYSNDNFYPRVGVSIGKRF